MRIISKLVILFILFILCFRLAGDENKAPHAIPHHINRYIKKQWINDGGEFKKFKLQVKKQLEKNKDGWQYFYSSNHEKYGLCHIYRLGQMSLTIYVSEQKDGRIAHLQKIWSSSPRGVIVDDVIIYFVDEKFSYDDKVFLGKGKK